MIGSHGVSNWFKIQLQFIEARACMDPQIEMSAALYCRAARSSAPLLAVCGEYGSELGEWRRALSVEGVQWRQRSGASE